VKTSSRLSTQHTRVGEHNSPYSIFGKGVDRTVWVAWLFYEGKANLNQISWTKVFPKML